MEEMMLAKFKKMRGTTGFVVGIIAALLLVPSVAAASGTLVNIVGAPSGNKAEVTAAKQVLVTPAQPANAVQSQQQYFYSGHVNLPIVTAPAADAIVVSNIAVDAYSVPSPGGSNDLQVYLSPAPSGACNSAQGWEHYFFPTGVGEIDLPTSPGLVIPAGWSLCGWENGIYVAVSISGQQVPAAEAAAPGSLGQPSHPSAAKHRVF
jgi:hypothetical protein